MCEEIIVNSKKICSLRLGMILLVVVVYLTACAQNEGASPYSDDEDQKELSTAVTEKSKSAFNSQEYDFRCADSILGMETSDQIFSDICGTKCRPPTADELKKIESCHVEFSERQDSQKVEQGVESDVITSVAEESLSVVEDISGDSMDVEDHHVGFDPESYDIGCIDGILGEAVSDEIMPDICGNACRELSHEELDLIKVCMSDEGATISGDSSHHHHGKQIAVPTALPEGVVAAVLKSVELPEPSYIVSENNTCDQLTGSECADIQWEPVNDLRAGEYTAIQIAPSNPDIVYAGIDSNDMSLYKSIDKGETWKLIHITGHTSGIAVSPTDPDVVVYTNLEGPMHRSVDGGLTWSSIDDGAIEEVMKVDESQEGADIFTAIVFSPDNGDIAYTSTVKGMYRSGTDDGPIDIFVSNNSGEYWEHAGVCETCGGAKFLAVQPGDSSVVWAATNNGVQVSRDGGATWSGNLLSEYTLQNEMLGVALRPGDPNTILAAGAESGMFRSTDGGVTWESVNTGLDTKLLHHVTFASSNSDVAYVATHEGVYRSDNAGLSWIERNNGLQYKFTTPIAVDPSNENIVLAGSASEVYTTHPNHYNPGLHEGEGLYKTVDGGENWFRSDTGVDEAKLVQMGTHPLLPFNLWADGESGRGAFFTPDAGENWLFSPNHAAHYPMVFAFSQTLPTEIYLTSWMNDGELMTSKDEGHNWTDLAPLIAAGVSDETRELGLYDDSKRRWLHLHGLAVAASDSNVIYVGSVHDTVYPDVEFNLTGAHIFKSVDGGESFVEMSNGFPIETRTSINVIVIHPTNPDIAYAMTSLHETEVAIGIYKTEDGGENWRPINNGLDLYTNDLQMDSISYDTLYAATERGVYKTSNGGEKWNRVSAGIPDDMPVIDLAIDQINPLVLYAITPDHVYRTRNGGDRWHVVDYGLPLLTSSEVASAQSEIPYPNDLARSNAAKSGHSIYGRTFAQDRSLEIDATGRVLYVVVKTKASDKYGPEYHKIRRLYRAILLPLTSVEYQFEVEGKTISVESTSHVYGMTYDKGLREIRFTSAGPVGTLGKTSINIPEDMIPGSYIVSVEGIIVDTLSDDGYVTFEYDHSGRNEVVISNK
ncbi:MAG TPA: hypothetical protein DCL76_06200 [Chloroflexi bacterium]|nr:hypothetical protein [Chloroflexota bacterium]